MQRATYREIPNRLYYRDPFVGNSCHAVRTPDENYYVWSYGTLILDYSLRESRVLMFNNRYYSVTTSRLQTMIRAAFPNATGGHSYRIVYEY
jgi:hypothetical protein